MNYDTVREEENTVSMNMTEIDRLDDRKMLNNFSLARVDRIEILQQFKKAGYDSIDNIGIDWLIEDILHREPPKNRIVIGVLAGFIVGACLGYLNQLYVASVL